MLLVDLVDLEESPSCFRGRVRYSGRIPSSARVLSMTNMKARESGMPGETYWESFYDANVAINRFIGSSVKGSAVEFGSGYGTFTVPLARCMTGCVTALDIEQEMIDHLCEKSKALEVGNIYAEVRDVVAHGTGLDDQSQAHAIIFNLLHLESPVELLREAYRVLSGDGVVSVMNWRTDIPTPRGPPLDIRPTPAQCREWMNQAGFRTIENVAVDDCCPYHYGLVGRK